METGGDWSRVSTFNLSSESLQKLQDHRLQATGHLGGGAEEVGTFGWPQGQFGSQGEHRPDTPDIVDQMVRLLRGGELFEGRILGKLECHRRGGNRLGSLTKHEGLLRRFRTEKTFRESQFDGPDLIGDLRESSRGLSRVSVRALRRDVCSAADIPAGLEQAGFELGEEGGQGRLRAKS